MQVGALQPTARRSGGVLQQKRNQQHGAQRKHNLDLFVGSEEQQYVSTHVEGVMHDRPPLQSLRERFGLQRSPSQAGMNMRLRDATQHVSKFNFTPIKTDAYVGELMAGSGNDKPVRLTAPMLVGRMKKIQDALGGAATLPRVRAIHGDLSTAERQEFATEIDKVRDVLSAIAREVAVAVAELLQRAMTPVRSNRTNSAAVKFELARRFTREGSSPGAGTDPVDVGQSHIELHSDTRDSLPSPRTKFTFTAKVKSWVLTVRETFGLDEFVE